MPTLFQYSIVVIIIEITKKKLKKDITIYFLDSYGLNSCIKELFLVTQKVEKLESAIISLIQTTIQ